MVTAPGLSLLWLCWVAQLMVTAGTLAGSSWGPGVWVACASTMCILDLGSWRPAMERGDRREV